MFLTEIIVTDCGVMPRKHAALGQAISIEVAWLRFVFDVVVDTSLQ